MNTNEVLKSIMKLAVAINNKDEAKCTEALSALYAVELSYEQKRSIISYEESLVDKVIEDESLMLFLESEIFLGQNIFDVKYVTTLAKISKPSATVEIINNYLDSNLSFEDPLKEYRYCFILSNRSIILGDISLMEKSIAKIDLFNSTHENFSGVNYTFGSV